MARMTIADVAARAGVSKSAVSLALNGRPGLADDTRARILVVAEEMGWRPSASARSLSTSRAFALGMIIARPSELLGFDPFFPLFIAGVESVLSERGNSLVLQVVTSASAEAEGYRRLAAGSRVDGVILSDLRRDDSRIPLLRDLGLPTVTLNRPDVPSPFPAVCRPDKAGIQASVDHLVALGHTRIAHVAGPDQYLHVRNRAEVWADALISAGLSAAQLVASDFTAAGGARATRELLSAPHPPTAIVYANDVMAIAGIATAAELGIDTPEQLSVIGFDDIPLAAHVHPALTTVSADPSGWGRAAAWTLLNLVDGPETIGDVADIEIEPAVFVARRSTGPVSVGG